MLKVVIAVDGSEHARRAIDAVAALAKQGCDLEAELLHVRDLPVIYGELPLTRSEELDALQRTHQNEVLDAAEKHAAKCGLRLAPSCRAVGFAADEIVQQAQSHGAHQIAMGTRGLGALRSLFIGSVAQRVVHLATVPVLLAK